MIKEYLNYILMALWAISIVVACTATWKVHSWKDGSDNTHAYQVLQQQTNDKLTQLTVDMKASSADSVALGQKVDLMKSSADILEESFRHDKAAKPATVGCLNPFTPDWVHDLNTSPTGSSP